MSEQTPEQGDVQDPAEPYQADQEVVTNDQPDTAADTNDGGDDSEDSASDEPDQPADVVSSVEVTPAAPPVKTDNVHGNDYEVTPERGYRKV